jgi:predicted MPP superfamily phosphohydrolase
MLPATVSAFGIFLGFQLHGTPLGIALSFVGAFWMLLLPYWLPAIIGFDVLRFINKRHPFFPEQVNRHPVAAGRLAVAAVALVIGAVTLYGYWHFSNPETVKTTVRLKKTSAARKTLHVAVASDLHMGDIINRERLAKYVAQINAIGADIILLAGDMVDNRLAPLLEQNMAAELAKLNAPLGVYAVLGNHDVFENPTATAAYLQSSGIHVLRDEVVPVGGDFYLAGRKDWSERRRRPVKDILGGLDPARPVLLLDHQPRAASLREAAAAGVDLQISGHTHGGQVWPITWVVRAMYPVAHGTGREGATQILVTSGLGLWGFPMRVGSDSEIVDLQVEFGE